MIVHELYYSATNTYLIEGARGRILFDTGWAGTADAFCRALGELRISVQTIDYILISHFHPDHMGIAQEIADYGAVIAAAEVQRPFIHAADAVFAKDAKVHFQPIDDEKIRWIAPEESRRFLAELGIEGEIVPTPGHSDDSISLALDDGSLFVGDLNPLYELALHEGTAIAESWNRLLARKPRVVYYGHARKAVLGEGCEGGSETPARASQSARIPAPQSARIPALQSSQSPVANDRFRLVEAVMKGVDRGWDIAKIRKKTGADATFVEDVVRMYLTHRGVGVQGILDRIEIKNK